MEAVLSSSIDEKILSVLRDSREGLDKLIGSKQAITSISDSAKLMIDCIKSNSRIFACGNGGSMCDSMHFCEELSSKFRKTRAAMPAISISDPAFISCVSNDFGYEFIFSRFLESNAREGDVLLAISTSGNSENIINASKYAQSKSIKVISLTGNRNSRLSEFSDVEICTPSGNFSDRVQELHTIVIHIIVQLIEMSIFPENYY